MAAWATDAWASHQHDHHMNKHIVRVVPCPECINRATTLIGAATEYRTECCNNSKTMVFLNTSTTTEDTVRIWDCTVRLHNAVFIESAEHVHMAVRTEERH